MSQNKKELNIDLEHVARRIASSAFEKGSKHNNKVKEKPKLKPFSFFAYLFSILASVFIANVLNNLLILSSIPDDVEVSYTSISDVGYLGILGIPVCIALFVLFVSFRLRIIFIPMLIASFVFTLGYEKINRVNYLEKRYDLYLSQIDKEDEGKEIFYKNRSMKFVPINHTKEYQDLLQGKKDGDESVLLKYREEVNQSKLIQISASNKNDLERAIYKSDADEIVKAYEKMNEDGIVTTFEFNEFAKKYVKR